MLKIKTLKELLLRRTITGVECHHHATHYGRDNKAFLQKSQEKVMYAGQITMRRTHTCCITREESLPLGQDLS